jgi:pimeloyl-ACP methyl ester carboxylesterase
VAEHDVRRQLPEIRVPTTCVAGTADVSAPLERSVELTEGIAGARLVTIDGGHMAYLEQPALFSELVGQHLRSARQ